MSTTQQPDPEHTDLDARFEFITRGLGRVDAKDQKLIRERLQEKERLSVLWGVAPTGRPHIGYLVPFVKIAEFIEAGLDVHIFLADTYAFLINYKYSREVVAQRTEYYRICLSALFEGILGVPASVLKFVEGSSFTLSEPYIRDIYHFLTITAQDDARAPNDELKNATMLSPLICPIMQALDSQYCKCDLELGGLDQAGLYAFADKFLDRLGYTHRPARMMNPMLPGLRGTKMSASDPRSKIDLLDPPDVVEQKIADAVCEPSMLEDNPILALLKAVLIPISKLRLLRQARGVGNASFVDKDAPNGTVYSIGTGGGLRHYEAYEQIEADYLRGDITPEALKAAVAKGVNQLLEHVRNSYAQNPEYWKAVLDTAYPPSEEEVSAAPSTTDASERFCYPAALKEISNDNVKLVPFNSSKHAAEFVRLSKPYPEMWTHIPIGPWDSTQTFVNQFIESFVRPKTDMLLYVVIDKTKPPSVIDEDGALAGIIAYINTSSLNQSTELGFVMTLPPFQRTHVTTNAIGLLLDFAFTRPGENGLGLRRVQWQTNSPNEASIKSAERMGFVKEGVLKWDRVYPGGRSLGKQGNGRSLEFEYDRQKGHFNENDIGRDTVILSMCWDDWFLEGKREHVFSKMARKA